MNRSTWPAELLAWLAAWLAVATCAWGESAVCRVTCQVGNEISGGSGTLIGQVDRQGYVLTAAHVVPCDNVGCCFDGQCSS